ncbi:MAG: hypothetical protein LBJ75_02710 [Puniceicoccales bacterium]|jgi:hypothetical protein|nr:hypothetical protein [Puniceicoccales bacterium]
MSSPLDPSLSSVASQGAESRSGTPDLVGSHAVKPSETPLSSEMAAAAKPPGSMPNTDLVTRTAAMVKKSQSMGVGGFFRALWNFISNSSTKSMDQARLNVIGQTKLNEVAKDYLQSNPGEVDGILREITTNTSSQDPKIVQAFVSALKEVDQSKFEGFCSAVKGSIDGILTKGAQMSSGITQDNIKHVADLVGKLGSVIEFSQPALVLHSLAQRLPADQITPDLIGFCNDFPEQAQALAERQDLQRTLFRGTDCNDGLTLACDDSHYDPEILSLIDAGLFEGEGRDVRIESFLKDPAVTGNQFYKDCIGRSGMPHVTLPNGVEILSNSGEAKVLMYRKERSEYNEMRGSVGLPSPATYLRYVLDQFKAAYGNADEAAKAFKVFVQNSTGYGNTLGMVMIKLKGEEAVCPGSNFVMKDRLISLTLMQCVKQTTMQMDKGFNITLNVNTCMSGEKIKETNQYATELGEQGFNENTIFGIAVSTYVPAVINDSMDQRGQHGKQTTTFGVMESFENGDSN